MSEEKRFIAIETKIAYHEHVVDTLNDTIVAQQRRIENLEARCDSLLERVATIAPPAEPGAPSDEVPPHY
jgi:SlyX protein